MKTQETDQLQITYYKNMEFFRDYNPKLFAALTQEPRLYNLHIDSYGYNIIHLPTQTKQYPIIAIQEKDNTAHPTPHTHTSSMQEAHSELAKDPMSNPKWELYSHYGAPFHTHFIDEKRLPTTGTCCNTLLKEGMQMGLQALEDSQKDLQKDLQKDSQKVSSNCTKDSSLMNQNKQTSFNHTLDSNTSNSSTSNSNTFCNSQSQSPTAIFHESILLRPQTPQPTQEAKIHESYSCTPNPESAQFDEEIHESTPTNKAQDNEGKAHKPNTATPNIATQSNAKLSYALLQAFQDSKLLPQTNLYGLMGGLFLQQLLDEGYSFHSLLIYEEHIDFFRISLYFLDYALLFERVGARSCFIIIKDISLPLVRAFLYAKKLTNNIMSLSLTHYTTPNVSTLKECIEKEKKAIMRGWGSLEDEMIGLKNALHNLKECRLLSTTPKRVHAPICVIGNGASLDLCFDFLRIYQDSMILISCGTALKVLRAHGITPDFQLEIERVPYLSNVLQEAGLGDIPLLFAQTTDTKACALSVEKYGFLRGGSSSAYLDSNYPALEFSAPFVGNAGVCLGALLGSDVLLCGIDCGYIMGYSKHAKGSFYGDEGTHIPKDCFQVEGAKSLPVFSNDLFYLSAKNIEEAIKFYQPNSAVNLGHGMRFDHTLSLYEDSLSLKPINKAQEIENFKANFTPYQLQHESESLIALLQEYEALFREICAREIVSLHDVFALTQTIFTFMQKNIDDREKRASMILLEGSITHLSYTHILAQCFVRVTQDLDEMHNRAKLQQLYADSISSFIQTCILSLHTCTQN